MKSNVRKKNEKVVPQGTAALDEFVAKFDKAYQKVAVAGRKAAPDYWTLGDEAVRLKKAVGQHKQWIPWLVEHNYVPRQIQRAMRIYRNFSPEKGGKEKLVELKLTVEEAEHYGRTPKDGKKKAKSKWSKLLTKAEKAAPTGAEAMAWEIFTDRFPKLDRAMAVALAMIRTITVDKTY